MPGVAGGGGCHPPVGQQLINEVRAGQPDADQLAQLLPSEQQQSGGCFDEYDLPAFVQPSTLSEFSQDDQAPRSPMVAECVPLIQ